MLLHRVCAFGFSSLSGSTDAYALPGGPANHDLYPGVLFHPDCRANTDLDPPLASSAFPDPNLCLYRNYRSYAYRRPNRNPFANARFASGYPDATRYADADRSNPNPDANRYLYADDHADFDRDADPNRHRDRLIRRADPRPLANGHPYIYSNPSIAIKGAVTSLRHTTDDENTRRTNLSLSYKKLFTGELSRATHTTDNENTYHAPRTTQKVFNSELGTGN